MKIKRYVFNLKPIIFDEILPLFRLKHRKIRPDYLDAVAEPEFDSKLALLL